jgi:hypothetical protein
LAPTKAEKLTPIVDDEPDPIRATSPAESTCIRSQSPTLPQSSSSLLNWEFSNVRVSTGLHPGVRHPNLLLTVVTAFAKPHIVISSLWKQVCRNTTKRSPGLQRRC